MSIDKAGSLIKVKGQNDIITIAIDFTTSVIAHFTLKKDVEQVSYSLWKDFLDSRKLTFVASDLYAFTMVDGHNN